MTSPANAYNAWVLIHRPILEVFQYVCDPLRVPEWVPFYSSPRVHAWDEDERAFSVDLGMSPWSLTETMKVIDMAPGRSVTFQSTLLAQTATYTFEPTTQGTLLTANHSPWGLSAMSPWMGFLRPWSEYALSQSLLQLKQRLEAMKYRTPKPLVFFSYRRREDRYIGGRVFEVLTREFGDGAVFRDVNSIASGENFEACIDKALADCKVFIAFIGPGWMDGFERHKAAARRPNPKSKGKAKKVEKRPGGSKPAPGDEHEEGRDWVLMEIAKALGAGDEKLVVPVIVDDSGYEGAAIMQRLPEEIRGLAKNQIRRLRPDPDFKADVEQLTAHIWMNIIGRKAIDVGGGKSFDPPRCD